MMFCKRSFSPFLTLALLVLTFSPALLTQVQGQSDEMQVMRATPDTLYPNPENAFTSIPAPRYILEKSQRAAGNPTSITGVITGATPAQEAALLYALDIWANSIYSPVEITFEADFKTIGGGALASAGPYLLYRDFAGAPVANTFYPSALVNSIVGCDLAPLTADIGISVDTTTNWYLGTDANPGAGEYDLVTVILHELAHGLSYVGSAGFDDGFGVQECNGLASNGCMGLQTAVPKDPFIYDSFVENGTSNSILSYTNPSLALGAQLIGNSLYWNGSQAVTANAGVRPSLYAPATFQAGSSFSHMDETTYPAGNVSSLMTPVLNAAEAIHSPGSVTLGMMEDMGWTLITTAFAEFHVRTVGYTGQGLLFQDCSALASSWEWDFDNDAVVDATTSTALYSYSTAGTYTAKLTINGNAALFKTVSIDIYDLPVLPYLEDFDADGGGFYSDTPGCLAWEWGAGLAKTNFNGVNATINGAGNWMTGLSAPHGSNTIYYLETPPFDFSSAVADIIIEFDYRSVTSADAGLNMEYSTDGGISWATLGSIGDPNALASWYNQASVLGLGGQEGWNQVSFTTFHPIYRANAFAGLSDVRFRFVFGADSIGSADGFQIDNFAVTSSVLVAGILEFEASKLGEQTVLTWIADRQLQQGAFVVERSADLGDFVALGEIPASLSAGQVPYSYTDRDPMAGPNYYRLRITDASGATDYSEIKTVTFGGLDMVSIFPNPASDFLTLSLRSAQLQSLRFRLFSPSGRIVFDRLISAPANTVELNLSSLAPGLYLYDLSQRGLGSTQSGDRVQRGKLILR